MTTETGDGAVLEIAVHGDSSGASVMLLHGFSLEGATWDRIVPGLVEAGYQVVVPDLRGHGLSTLGSATADIDRLVADALVVANAVGIDRFHLAGHSLGAVVALAARVDASLEGRMRSIVSIAGTEQSIQNPIMRLGSAFFNSRVGVAMLGRPVPGRAMISTWFGRSPQRDDLDWIRAVSARCSQPTRKGIVAGTSAIDLRPTFAEAGPPTTLLSGRRDQATPTKISQRIAQAIDGAHMHVIDDAGHMVIIERPSEVTELLLEAFASADA